MLLAGGSFASFPHGWRRRQVRQLLHAGAATSARTQEGRTPRALARQAGHVPVVELLDCTLTLHEEAAAMAFLSPALEG